MSHPSSAAQPTSRSVAILGADALLVALPSTPTQLANACFAGGFGEVFPATWGDELIAAGCLEQLESRTGPAIFCSCPLVAEQLRGAAELRRFIVPLISPPIAAARYVRALYAGDTLTITYIGDCPGADDESIDVRLSPHELLAQLAKRGILPATQRPDLGAHAVRDRRRFYSLPGGVPSPQWLGLQWPKRTLVDVHAGDALAGLANQTLARGHTLIDFAPHLGCACAGAVGGTSAQDARTAVVALEPPRARSEIVGGEVRVEVSLAPPGERHLADVTWSDFLAALPAALAMPADGVHASTPLAPRSPRRACAKAIALPRAYLAARHGARRDRREPARVPAATAPIDAAAARAPDAPSSMARESSLHADASRRAELATPRPTAWVTRRASHEGMTGPRGYPLHRAPLAPADRWLFAGLTLAGSFLVAWLTSALTVSGMQRSRGAMVAARHDTVVMVAAAPRVASHDSAPSTQLARVTDSALVATSRTADGAPQHEDGGTVAPPPATAPRLARVPAHHPPPARRVTIRAPRQPLSVAERTRVAPRPLAFVLPPPRAVVPPPAVTTPAPSGPPPATLAPAVSAPTPAPATPPAAAAAPLNNAQFLEELRAIHAEIDARKRRMDSLASSLDSLRRIAPPR